ncbi:ATP-NAD kinase [Desulfomarina profundi]|uniref:ATP-NAD kinase n=1 Tax=Desulfomarina profundi TaxID=2772557 RepID=A0A8D5FJ24_9BACT|nr:ATP-NAD kinase family protein [Desulfomarina profundi]BCL61486.1 ATP-NAD kinase [Desulfomarina profundi]
MKSIGFIVNPIAGMGGRVGLKGTDGLAEEARQRGALPLAPARGQKGLIPLRNFESELQIFTPAKEMGEAEAKREGFAPTVIGRHTTGETGAADTRYAAKEMVQQGVELILFAGGDGTARDIYSAIGEKVPVIGIPAGVKIHSPVFAQTAQKAGELAKLFLAGQLHHFDLAEVLDIDEEAYRNGQVKTRLHGYLNVPVERLRMQNRKSGTPLTEKVSQNSIALDIIDNMAKGVMYLVGPGSTTRPIMENLGLPCTLLGVDLVMDGQLIAADATEKTILKATKQRNFKIIVTPIGGQGYIFGRGNHQLSHRVLRLAGKENIIVIATREKLIRLRGEPLLVDTGDISVDQMLGGYIRVTTGYKQQMITRVR